jgi:hypothetical protein
LSRVHHALIQFLLSPTSHGRKFSFFRRLPFRPVYRLQASNVRSINLRQEPGDQRGLVDLGIVKDGISNYSA